MKFYIEITLLPSVDVAINFLWSKLYQQIHLALVDMSDGNGAGTVPIGIAFPQYDPDKHQLGGKLRLFAAIESDLVKLDIKKWLNHLLDYVHITKTREVPNNVKSYAVYKRKQPTRSFAKLKRTIRRKAEREGINTEEAKNRLSLSLAEARDKKTVIDDMCLIKTPFIEMKSMSSDKRFRLFVAKELASNCIEGNFGSYGFSDKATVPEF